MINYPLTPGEARVVSWTGGLMTVLALAMIALLGALAFASP